MNHSITTSFTSLIFGFFALTAPMAVAQTLDIHVECAPNFSCAELSYDKSRFGEGRFQADAVLKISESDVLTATVAREDSTQIGGLIILKKEFADKFESVQKANDNSKVAIVVSGEVTDVGDIGLTMLGNTLIYSKNSDLPKKAPWVLEKVFKAPKVSELLQDGFVTKFKILGALFPIALVGYIVLRRRRRKM